MSPKTTTASPGAISRAALDWLKAAADLPQKEFDADTIEAVRRQTRQAAVTVSNAAVKSHGVLISELQIAEVPVMVIDPSVRQGNRTLLYLFGGGFTLGSPFEDLPISAALAAKTGAQVIAPDYRLAPEHPYPAALDDIEAVASAVLQDNPRALLAGESAGANLALALTHRLRTKAAAVPGALALLSPPTNFADQGESAKPENHCDPTLSPKRTRQVEAAYIGDQSLQNPELSPIYGQFDASFPACFITTGTRDMFLSSSIKLDRVLRQSGAKVDLRIWEGMWHVFEYYPEIPESDASLTEIARFLNSHFA